MTLTTNAHDITKAEAQELFGVPDMVQFCAETNAPETISEITADLEAEYQAIREARGYDMAAE